MVDGVRLMLITMVTMGSRILDGWEWGAELMSRHAWAWCAGPHGVLARLFLLLSVCVQVL